MKSLVVGVESCKKRAASAEEQRTRASADSSEFRLYPATPRPFHVGSEHGSHRSWAAHAWFLFRRGSQRFLDVNCSYLAFGHCVGPPSPDEAEGYLQEGRSFLQRLAERVQGYGPGIGDQLRDVRSQYQDELGKALDDWRSQSET